MKITFITVTIFFASIFRIYAQETTTSDSSRNMLTDSSNMNIYSTLQNNVDVKSSAGNAVSTQPIKKTMYRIRPGIDIPLTVAGDAWSLYGMSIIYGRDPVPEAEVLRLNKKDINSIDRFVANNYSESAAMASNYFFYGSMPLPLVLMLDKKIRKDAWKVGMLYLEAVGITGGIYVTSAMTANRFRPYTYNNNAPMSKRTRGGARNSFFAGHVAVAATSFFFTSQVYIDYHPAMKHKWVLYTGAGLLSATTGFLRIQAGEHFLTDVTAGLTVGTLSGLLVPYIHRIKAFRNSGLTILPNLRGASSGFTLLYDFDKKRS